MSKLSVEEKIECARLLKKSVLMRYCSDKQLDEVAESMTKNVYNKDQILSLEGQPQTKMFVISHGSVIREKNTEDGRVHHIDTFLGGQTVGSLHIMNRDPSYATSKCTSDGVVTYELTADAFEQLYKTKPDFAWNVSYSLTHEIRRHTRQLRTPLLEQHPKKTPIMAISVAAAVESFYRAALNSILNQKLTGVPMTSLFPNMHIQVPTRIVYINGFKGIRQYLDNHVNPDAHEYPTLVRLAAAITPGVLMTPLSSILEASNAGHSNPESMATRWIRGLVPRGGREVIYGIGLNQLSDYCEERVPSFVENATVKNALGSLAAGVISGYFSHVIHNLSTLKLMNPNKTYGQHFSEYCQKSEQRIPFPIANPATKRWVGIATACLAPAGVHIRTSQIVGSFIILNGTINAMQRWLK